jgi:hypothetical protein
MFEKSFVLVNSDQEDLIRNASLKISLFKCLIIFLSICGLVKLISWINKFLKFIQRNCNRLIKKMSFTKSLNKNNNNNSINNYNNNNNNNNVKLFKRTDEDHEGLENKKKPKCRCCSTKHN